VRKRIVIGVIAAVVIGVGVYVLTLPKKGTVEWHSARYIALLTEDSWAERLSQTWGRLRGRRAVPRTPPERVFKELQLHEKALVKLGYFEERRFLVFDGRAEGAMTRAISLWRSTQSNAIVRPQFDAVFIVGGSGTNEMGSVRSIGRKSAGDLAESLIVVTRPAHMPQWAQLVQRSDSGRPKKWEDITNIVHRSRFRYDKN
jgi:hypothetical protein